MTESVGNPEFLVEIGIMMCSIISGCQLSDCCNFYNKIDASNTKLLPLCQHKRKNSSNFCLKVLPTDTGISSDHTVLEAM